MTDCPREEILALVAVYGPDVLDMSRTVESELHLHCPDQLDEVNALVAALRHGVVHYLLVLAGEWADIMAAIRMPRAGEAAWRQKPRGLPHTVLAALAPVLIIGAVGAVASMLPGIVVVTESHGEHFLIPVKLGALGTHACLNLAGAAGAFLGGAVGWMVGTPFSLEFVRSAGKASVRRVGAAALATALGAFFGLWLGYHHIADIGAFLGAFLGAGLGAFLACVFTWNT